MTGTVGGQRGVVCRDLGYVCEWELRTGSPDELLRRYREHFRCAHGGSDPPPELLGRLHATLAPT